MQPDLLQQLRDIHLPAEPIWWPPAPGWWLLAIVLIGLLIWSVVQIRLAIQRRRPIRLARAYYDDVYAAYQRGQIDATAYLQQTNELLKRLYIHALHDDAARPLTDTAWLHYLDERSACGGSKTDSGGSKTANGGDFTKGPGAQLGNQRFRPEVQADPEALHPLVANLLKAARP